MAAVMKQLPRPLGTAVVVLARPVSPHESVKFLRGRTPQSSRRLVSSHSPREYLSVYLSFRNVRGFSFRLQTIGFVPLIQSSRATGTPRTSRLLPIAVLLLYFPFSKLFPVLTLRSRRRLCRFLSYIHQYSGVLGRG